jgi:DUF917 family protein
MATRINDLETVTDMCWGLAFFGTGGGGKVEAGIDLLTPAIRAGREITLVSPDELADDVWTCWALIVGGKDPDEEPPAEELARFGLVRQEFPDIVPRLVAAARELSAFRKAELGALVSMELSSAATAATIMTGLELGIPTLDSDYVGRAIPEIVLNTLELRGILPTPVAMIDRWGNRLLLKSAVSAAMTDRIGRMVSRAAYGRGIATTGHFLQMRAARPALVRGSVLRALAAGRALRKGAGDRDDRLAALKAVTGGRLLFEAEVVATEWRDTQPYTFRELTYRLKGIGAWAGADFAIWVKNEHHAVWRDDIVIATSPDVVAVLDSDTNRPLTTLGEVTDGRRVAVFAVKALDPVWATAQGRALLGPRHFDLGFDYVDFEEAAG